MIKDIKLWEDFEKEWYSGQKPVYEENILKFQYMHSLYSSLEKNSSIDKLEGIEIKIRIAKILNRTL